MSSVIKIIFAVDGQEDEVINLSYSFDQNIDNIGQPAGAVRGGQIVVTLGTTGRDDRFGWMVASDMKKSGELKFIDSDSQTLKTLKFEDAYCVGYTEDYEALSGGVGQGASIKESAKETLTLSCRVISVEGETHDNSWVA